LGKGEKITAVCRVGEGGVKRINGKPVGGARGKREVSKNGGKIKWGVAPPKRPLDKNERKKGRNQKNRIWLD